MTEVRAFASANARTEVIILWKSRPLDCNYIRSHVIMSWKKISIVIGATIVVLEYDESLDYDRDILSCLISWREF